MISMRVLELDADEITVYEVPIDKPYINVSRETFCTFDIETTLLEKYKGQLREGDGLSDKYFSVMYLWQMCIGDNKERKVIVGRTWKDFLDFVERIPPLIWYIHNLQFEWQFLQSLFTVKKMFATAKRKPVRIDLDNGIQLRCSYKLTNMSLAKFCKNEGVKHLKQGNYNYGKKRFSDTPLNDEELLYGVCDVLGLHEAICHSTLYSEDDMKSVPYTSTGYVRREARKAVQENYKNRLQMLDRQLTEGQYMHCKASVRGGNTHANPAYVGLLIGEDDIEASTVVYSHDKSSSYPYEMLSSYYPIGKFIPSGTKQVHTDKCSIIDIVFNNLRCKEDVYCPYISYSKCQQVSKQDLVIDNGRIYSTASARMVITEIDYQIITSQYYYDEEMIISQSSAGRGYLPKEYRDFIFEYYRQKCLLKHGDKYLYNKFKNKINALFGMMLTDICREEIVYDEGEWSSYTRPINELLEEYYKKWSSFLSYQDGVYVTAHARQSLQEGIDLVGSRFIYSDTDSVKHMSTEHVFDNLNKGIVKKLEASGYGTVIVGNEEYTLGVWEKDDEYSAFITLGAKKYAYRETHGDVSVTVSGLSKEKGTEYIKKHGLKSFVSGTMFNEDNSGRMTAVYDDNLRYEQTTYNGHPIEITSSLSLVPTTYTLSVTKDYNNFLNYFRNNH